MHHFIYSSVNTSSSRSAKLNIKCIRFYYLCVCDHIEMLMEFSQGVDFNRLLGSRLVGAAEVKQHHVKCSDGIKIWQHTSFLRRLLGSLCRREQTHLVLLKANLHFLLVLACFNPYSFVIFPDMDMVKHKGKRYGSCNIKCLKVFFTAGMIGKLSFVRKNNVVLDKNIFLLY